MKNLFNFDYNKPENLISLIGKKSSDPQFLAAFYSLKAAAKNWSNVVVHEPLTDDLLKSEIIYFYNCSFVEAGVGLHVDEDVIVEVLFEAYIDSYGNKQIPYANPVFGIDLTSFNSRKEIRQKLGKSLVSDQHSEFYIMDNLRLQFGFRFKKPDSLSYIRVNSLDYD